MSKVWTSLFPALRSQRGHGNDCLDGPLEIWARNRLQSNSQGAEQNFKI